MDGVAIKRVPHEPAIGNERPSPHLDGTMGFAATAASLTGWECSMVTFWAIRNFNVVHMEHGQAVLSSLLSGGSSDWLSKGGAAHREADLCAYGWKGACRLSANSLQSRFNAQG